MKNIIILLAVFIPFWYTHISYGLNADLERIYSSFLGNLEKKYSLSKQELILNTLSTRIDEILSEPINITRETLIQELNILNNEALFDIWQEKELSQASQISLELSLDARKNQIPYSQLTKEFSTFLTSTYTFREENDFYFGYNFNSFRFYENKYWVSEWDLAASGFSKEKELLYKDEDGRYNFISDYKKNKLVAAPTIFWVPMKERILSELRDDAKFPTQNIDTYMREIKSIAEELSAWKTREQTIEAIYSWILENISYSEVIDLNDERIFSAIETFKNSEWVCTGYTKLMLYMLAFAGVRDVEVIRGQVIDAQDFPEIGHAWIRIGDRYYDPTFDDPVWALDTKSRDEYTYFGLPRDIFYANRFEYADLPESFKTKTDPEIREYIFNYLRALLPKYKWQSEYDNVFAPVRFRETYNISHITSITPSLLSEKIGSYTVNNDSFTYTRDGTQKRITGIKYFVLTSQNTERVLQQLFYDTDSLSLFNWQTESWAREWRLAYQLDEL